MQYTQLISRMFGTRFKSSFALLLTGTLCLSAHADLSMQGTTICAAKAYEMSLKYQQQSAEIQALQLQAYQIATLRLQHILAQMPEAKNLAIVIDLDETVLDNSDFLVSNIQHCIDYTEWTTWSEWEKNGQPKLIVGSLDFLNFASQHQVAIFYVSDRSEQYRTATINTLKRLGLPQASNDHVLLYGKSKEQRRQLIAQNHQIVLLIGDTLHDFSQDFNQQQSKSQRQAMIEKNQSRFGQDWIMLPNTSYGAWSKDAFTEMDRPEN